MNGNGNDLLITGTPRSGTTLTCHLLNKVPNTLALHEPMRPRRLAELATADERLDEVERFMTEQRRMALDEGRVVSKNADGKVPDNPLTRERTTDGQRKRIVSRGYMLVDKPLAPDFALVVKHNSGFAALLDELVTRFPVFAIVRNPLATLGSWSSVPFNVQDGHAGVGEGLDPRLERLLSSIHDPLDRQIALLDWFHRRFVDILPPERIIRYEDIVQTGGRRLSVVRPEAAMLDEPLVERTLTELYDRDYLLRAGERLLREDGAFWVTYRRDEVAAGLAVLERSATASE